MRRGISVIEMLVVLAVLAAMSALLIPALSHVSRQARTARCMANLGALQQLAWAEAQSAGFLPERHPDPSLRCPVRQGEYRHMLGSEPEHLRSLLYLEHNPWTLLFVESERRHGPRLGVRFELGSVGPVEE